MVAGGEECDDGNFSESDACLNDCTFATCSDGVVHVGTEECDDGNVTEGDGCDAHCRFEVAPVPGAGCGLVAKVRQLSPVQPGKRFTMRLIWMDTCSDATDIEISTLLPAFTELVKVKAGVAHSVGEDSVTFFVPGLRAGLVGRAKIVLRLQRSTPAWSSLASTTFISDARGRVASSQVRSVSQARKAKEYIRLYGPSRPMPNERVRYRAKYSNKLEAGNTVRMTIGPDVEVEYVSPEATSVENGVVVWEGMGAGKHKLEVEGTFRLREETAFGAVLNADVVLGWGDGYELRDNHTTAADLTHLLFD